MSGPSTASATHRFAPSPENGPTHLPLEDTLGRVLWLALETLGKRRKQDLFVEYLYLLKNNLRSRPPRCLLDGLPTYLQQEIELATFNWQPRFTWENLEADEVDLENLYNARVVKLAEGYYCGKQQKQLLTSIPMSDGGVLFHAFLLLLQVQAPLASCMGAYIGTPIHRCNRCTNAFALASKNTYMVFYCRLPWEHWKGGV